MSRAAKPLQGLCIVSAVLLLLTSPADAKWHYCYSGAPPEGVNQYPDMPPRPFGFMDYALWPHVMKKLCGHPFETEAAHVRRIVADYLECSPTSDLGQEVEQMLTLPRANVSIVLFGQVEPPLGAEWSAVCTAAAEASIGTSAFGDSWYFDSDTPDQDAARLDALLDAMGALSEALNGTDP